MSNPYILAIIGILGSLLTIIVSKWFERLISKSGAAAQREEALTSGLRSDLARKESELSTFRTLLKDTDEELDQLKLNYWKLWEVNMRLRGAALSAAVAAGYSAEQINAMLPALPPSLDEL